MAIKVEILDDKEILLIKSRINALELKTENIIPIIKNVDIAINDVQDRIALLRKAKHKQDNEIAIQQSAISLLATSAAKLTSLVSSLYTAMGIKKC